MSAVEHLAGNMPARGVWHSIIRCKYCRDRFGTQAAFELHKPKPADKRSRQLKRTGKVRRFLCRGEKTLIRHGAWRGYGGVWWTVETDVGARENGRGAEGGEDTTFSNRQNVENTVVILDKIGTLDSAIPENRKPHNRAGFRASVSKFPEGGK